METKTECSARLEIEMPPNTDMRVLSVQSSNGEFRRIGVIQSYRQESKEVAENLVLEIVNRLNEALDE